MREGRPAGWPSPRCPRWRATVLPRAHDPRPWRDAPPRSLPRAYSTRRTYRSARTTWDARRRTPCSDTRCALGSSLLARRRVVLEPRVRLVKEEIHETDWSVALLADD